MDDWFKEEGIGSSWSSYFKRALGGRLAGEFSRLIDLLSHAKRPSGRGNDRVRWSLDNSGFKQHRRNKYSYGYYDDLGAGAYA
ncbi:hypothetical protein Dimus_010783 [Dionaea muscipula]